MYEDIIKEYRMVYDHHTHTTFSHGKGSMEDNVKVAIEKGLESIAFTDHGPGNFRFGMDRKRIPEMKEEVARLRKKYTNIEILLGVELNSKRKLPFIDMELSELNDFDILLCGYHYSIFGAGMIPNWIYRKINGNGGLKYSLDENGEYQAPISMLMIKNTGMIMNMLKYIEEEGKHIDCLTHPGDKGPFDIYDIAKTCEETGTLLEVNLKHKHLTVEELKVASRFDVKFVIGSDAHTPERVGQFEPQLERILMAGIDPARVVNIKKK